MKHASEETLPPGPGGQVGQPDLQPGSPVPSDSPLRRRPSRIGATGKKVFLQFPHMQSKEGYLLESFIAASVAVGSENSAGCDGGNLGLDLG